MAAKKRSGNTVEAVWKLAQPFAEELGLSIWDVRFLKEGAEWYLRIFIDKEEGVGIEDCEAMSRAINKPLDDLDPIDQSYCLEVCSPGLNRELTRPEHFEAFLGAPVGVRMIRPLEDGSRMVTGTLLDYEDPVITIGKEDGETISITKKETSCVRLMEDDFLEDLEG